MKLLVDDTRHTLDLEATIALQSILPRMLEFAEGSPITRLWVPKIAVGFFAGRTFRAGLDFRRAPYRWIGSAEEWTGSGRVHLHLKDDRDLVDLLQGDAVAIRPGYGIWHVAGLLKFQTFANRFQTFLRMGTLGKKEIKDCLFQARLLLDLTLDAAIHVAAQDPWLKSMGSTGPAGWAHFGLRGLSGEQIDRWIYRSVEGVLKVCRSEPEAGAAVSLIFPTPEAAISLISQATDSSSGTALGQVEVRGFIPLADALNLVFDQIPRYTPPLI